MSKLLAYNRPASFQDVVKNQHGSCFTSRCVAHVRSTAAEAAAINWLKRSAVSALTDVSYSAPHTARAQGYLCKPERSTYVKLV